MITKAQNAINACEEHLQLTNSFSTEIEAYFVQYLLIVICAECERYFVEIANQRISLLGNKHISNYFDATSNRMLQSIHFSQISGFLGYFGDDLKQYFSNSVDEKIKSYWSDIITNRNAVAHGTKTVQLTFNELKEKYQTCSVILLEFERALQRLGTK